MLPLFMSGGVAAIEPEVVSLQQAFQRIFCDRCFDEVFLERRNFDTKVELHKTIVAKAGTLVQSDGERLIADWLAAQRGHRLLERVDDEDLTDAIDGGVVCDARPVEGAAHDAGRVVNPALCSGQVEGAVHMGLGYALTEELRCENGMPVTFKLKEIGVHVVPSVDE